MSDVQNTQLKGSFKLTRVGVRNVKKPVRVSRPGKEVTLVVTFDLFVDLPAELKGSHMSRNLEVLSRVVDEAVRTHVPGLEDLGAMMCQELLSRHEYATRSEVLMSADYFLERGMGSGTTSLEWYVLRASAHSTRGGETRKSIGVEVTGMTACPCAMEEVRKMRNVNSEDLDASITHNQRNVTSVSLEVPMDRPLEADKLIGIIERCLSSPTFEILKRTDEAKVVINAHSNPKFVEDVVRDVLAEILTEFRDLPDDVCVSVKSESFESIHKHNAYAERDTTMGELRA
ncbi:MAG: GTP cyclohydrolase I FolE2 [Candidatus Thermoplasmatota archaeon]|nr:GTP cyclohydrolase I FolE2 [Euryarchaeota archaeon]MBU4032563.1 GTP cyclohydrolase I FolE2 [Candidatus Thermoplasmatota archaeon]MBU4070545.1 GTP cyclohydrolase I FolE2 [Candidatus Thermoplasmatota archaeon]MBU4144658.1 GTP cyclohydrolase I FolE2 [Candidatus Thermoplasmatota archaeon]MBU4592727.1 GTP cyclohydrolase I FolE2 [Candidatus Thermoplasmatota archaeon]